MNSHHYAHYGHGDGLVLVLLLAVAIFVLVGKDRGALAVALVAVLALFACGGCAAMPTQEITWQVMHAADVAETAQAMRQPCYSESDPITRPIIGTHPSPRAVVEWGVGLAVLHAGVAAYLGEHAPRIAKVWEYVTITETGVALMSNARHGVRPRSVDRCAP